MSLKPLRNSSVASRCVCMKCGRQPDVQASGSDPITMQVECCGESETRTVTKAELLYTQRFFGDEEDTQEFDADGEDDEM